jgi:uncharacterized phage protein gp47/JayE
VSTATFIDDLGFHLAVGPNAETGLSGWLSTLTTSYLGIYGSTADVSPASVDGQWLGTLAETINDFEQLLLTIYNGRSPARAIGAGLSRLVQLNGIARKSSQFSLAPITLTGTPGTVVPIGSLIGSLSDPTIPPFATVAACTIGGGGGPIGTVTGQAICTVAGPINVASGDLTVIQTKVPGWTNVTNTSAATPGILLEQDPALRQRRTLSVATPSQSMLDGLEGALNNLAGMNQARVYENPTAATNANGDPAHSIHVIVDGGVDADIANAILTHASMGVTKVGASSAIVTDSQGNPQLMQWDVKADVKIYVTVRLSPPTGAPVGWTPDATMITAIQNALVAYGQAVARIGVSVNWYNLSIPITALGITGADHQPSVIDVFLGDTPSPTLQQDLVIPFNCLPNFSEAFIVVSA